MKKELFDLKNELNLILTENILPFWMQEMLDNERGGFYGQITGKGDIVKDAPKGAILNARILWTFSSAYKLTKTTEYLITAARAKEYFVNHFIDKDFGGVFWSLDCEGKPLDTKKQIYAISFAIYGLSEYFQATGDLEVLDLAKNLFWVIEKHAFDNQNGGYFEAFARDWSELEDMRLSEKDANERKTMNTHLHILESYTNLFRAWKNPVLKDKIKELLLVFTDRIVDKKTNHLNLFFTDDWKIKGDIISYGHEIETSWLMHEAILVINDPELLSKIEPIIQEIAEASQAGMQEDGSLVYEKDLIDGHTDLDRHWWVQAEAVVGFFNLYQNFDDNDALQKTLKCITYIKRYLLDIENGEWFWSVKSDGEINRDDDKAGFWKCPYHNSRMCIELIQRISETEKI